MKNNTMNNLMNTKVQQLSKIKSNIQIHIFISKIYFARDL